MTFVGRLRVTKLATRARLSKSNLQVKRVNASEKGGTKSELIYQDINSVLLVRYKE